jgi:DNA polymerase elongation subunit (family B)
LKIKIDYYYYWRKKKKRKVLYIDTDSCMIVMRGKFVKKIIKAFKELVKYYS